MRTLTTLAIAVLVFSSTCTPLVARPQAIEESEQPQPKAPRLQPIRVASNALRELLVYRIEPEWPETDEMSPEILLQVTLNESGEVWNVRTIRAPRALREAAVEAVQQWLYLPLMLEGHPVPAIGTVRLYPGEPGQKSPPDTMDVVALVLRIDASGVVWDGEEKPDEESMIERARQADAVGPVLVKKGRGASEEELRALVRLLINAGIRNIRAG